MGQFLIEFFKRIGHWGGLLIVGTLAALLFLPMFIDAPWLGSVMLWGAAVACVLTVGSFIWFAPKSAPVELDLGEQQTSRPVISESAALEAKKSYYRWGIGMSLLFLFLVTAFVNDRLNQLESGSVPSIGLWAPIALVYHVLGHTAAVVATAGYFAMGCILCTYRLYKLSRISSDPA